MTNNELRHYGILGMKWGIHRARKKGTTYQYKGMYTKNYERMAKKLRDTNGKKSSIEKFERMAQESQKIDDKMQKIAENMSVGKGIAHLLLSNPAGGSRHYLQTVAINGQPEAKKTNARRQIGIQVVGALTSYLNMPYIGFGLNSFNETYTENEREIAIKKAMGVRKK